MDQNNEEIVVLQKLSKKQKKMQQKKLNQELHLYNLYEDLLRIEAEDEPKEAQNMNLEKQYFRLTKEVDYRKLRPQHILQEAVDHLLKKWENKEADYQFISDQFRSIRQKKKDLIVQNIENEFTVEVYEWNARIAIDNGDFQNYEYCQTMLDGLQDIPSPNHGELWGYNLIYATFKKNYVRLMKIWPQIYNLGIIDDDLIVFAEEQ